MTRSPVLVGTAALLAGLGVLALGLQLSGYDAALALAALVQGSFGSWYVISSATLVRAVPLIVIGLGIAIAFRANALNIGAEGQFYVGAIAATWVGLHLGGWNPLLAIPTVWLVAGAAGVLWIVLPVWLKRRFGVLEVISTLLLNFVAESLVSWAVQGPLQETRRVYPQSDPIAEAARLPLVPGTRLHLGFILALGLALVVQYVFRRTIWGFELLATGSGPKAAEVSGAVKVTRVAAFALLWSGLFAGLAGGIEVAGVSYALFQNLSPGYGFSGIAVALLARLEPVAVLLTGLVFGALEAGGAAMQRDAGVPSVAVYVVEGVVILVLLLAEAATRRMRSAVVAPDAEAGSA
jgi:ABC-type uncharacterized transport system permease subunit